MSEPNKSEVLDLIQATLEKLKDSGDDIESIINSLIDPPQEN